MVCRLPVAEPLSVPVVTTSTAPVMLPVKVWPLTASFAMFAMSR